MGVIDEHARERIDEVLRDWRQGDCVLGEHWFLFRVEVEAPLTEEAAEAASEGVDVGEAEVRGFMVVTQSCDIVRSRSERPFIEVCPLVEMEPERMEEVRPGRRPSYAFVPGVADRALVADLDRAMTVEKTVVARWKRTVGCRDDDEPRFEERGWDDYLEAWLDRLPPGGRFTSVEGLVQTLDDLTARDYVESDSLDLDHLSFRKTTA